VSESAPTTQRPNIVFAFADDWGRYAGAYAPHEGPQSLNALIQTPNFDRVAREGVIFTNAFVPAPSCTPCRSSVLSGRYFWNTGLGAILQGAVWDSSIPSYPLLLEEAGYHIGHTYKVWSPGTPRDEPYGAERTRYAPAGTRFGQFSFVATEHTPELGVDGAKQLLLDETRQNFDAFLDARPDGKPFCYWWGPTNTHRKWVRGSGKELWGLEPDDLKGRLPAFLPDVHEIREDVCDYLGECQAFDAGLGVVLDRLEEIGELDNTLIVVSGDHGIPGMPRGKCNLYDIGSEVALAAHGPVPDVPRCRVRGESGRHGRTRAARRSRIPRQRPDRPRAHVGRHRSGTPRLQRARGQPALPAAGDPNERLPLHSQLCSRPLAHGRPKGAR